MVFRGWIRRIEGRTSEDLRVVTGTNLRASRMGLPFLANSYDEPARNAERAIDKMEQARSSQIGKPFRL